MFAPLRILLAPAVLASSLAAQDEIDFNRDVRPILAGHCVHCHGPDAKHRKGGDKKAGGLRLDREDGSRRFSAIVPRRPDLSEVLRRVTATDGDRMPPRAQGKGLSAAEVATLRKWIAQGAKYAKHWSFAVPRRPALPDVADAAWGKNPVDRFTHRAMVRAKLEPSPPADRARILRRVAFDLTGLPPSAAERERFLADRSPGAYGRLVDRLLASPAYGEHLARHWLDLARYADSAGYADDPKRTIWAYRDWVIRAFQKNQPFDRFTIEQLAGDLLPEPTDDQLIATAFHRNTMTNSEGGTDDEEFRSVAVVDRVNTTMATWMGTTANCAQCHDHKYDPLSQKEFFQLYAFFNSTQDSDKRDERPTLKVYDAAQKQQRAAWTAELGRLRGELADSAALRDGLAAWDAAFPRDAEWAPVRLGAAVDGRRRVTAELPTITALRGKTRRPGRVALRFVPAEYRPPKARFVRISMRGARKILSLAEVQVFAGGVNVARKGKARQHSTDYGGPARLAIDGNTDGHFSRAKSTTHTRTTKDPWWEVDLGQLRNVERIVVWNRTDSRAISNRLQKFRVELLGADRQPVFAQDHDRVPLPKAAFSPGGARTIPTSGRFAQGAEQVFVLGESVTLGRDVVELSGPGTGWLATSDVRFAKYAAVPAAVLGTLAVDPERRDAKQRQQLRDHYLAIAPELAPVRARVAELEQKLKSLRPRTTVPILRELASGRQTHVHVRGNFMNKGAKVAPGVPEAFAPLPDGPRNRLTFAKWLVSADNPLTARVIVNRFWELIFGRGLVATSEDFGTRGDLPSHPELLDWLAVEFVESGWDVKRLLKSIVMSRTYRQTSVVSMDRVQRDPDNRWLSRGPSVRLSAEMIRDQALAVSRLLSDKRFGPPVRPPRPSLGLRAAFGGSTDWQDSGGEDRYRRGLYTLWQRSIPYPSMAVFDAPSREVCTVRRQPTNTPLQALVTLNDPVYVEAAQALARRMLTDGGDTTPARIAYGLQRALVRDAKPEEVDRLARLFRAARQRYTKNADAAQQMATRPLGPLPKGIAVADAAAMTVVANVLLNLDEILVKR